MTKIVKNYAGVRTALLRREMQEVHVKEYMTSRDLLVTFRPDQPIGQVVAIMLDKRLDGGPVLDSDGKLIGIISEGDCLKQVVKGKYSNVPSHPGIVADHMVKEVITIEADVNILEAAQRFLAFKVRRFPVMKDGELIGQVSQRDVLRAVENLEHETW